MFFITIRIPIFMRVHVIAVLMAGFSLLFLSGYGQDFMSDIKKPDFQPPSPEASSQARFGQYEVSLNTGSPGISIPIYSIQLPNFTFPISISYNAAGVKVSEVGSRLGIGWSLDAGGTVSRNAIGLNDDNYTRYIPAQTFSPVWGNLSLPAPADYTLAKHIIDDKAYDTEPDLWYYNFMGYSGKYVEDPFTSSWVPLPFSNNVINDGGTWIDASGNKYYFEEAETMAVRSECTSYSRDKITNDVTASYLTKIETPNGDVIELTYETERYKYFQSYSQKKYFRQTGEPQTCPLPDDIFCLQVATATVPRLTQITATNGIVVDFQYGAVRPDVEVFTTDQPKMLSGIVVRNVNSSEQFTYSFEYEQITAPVPTYTYGASRASDRERMYLTKFTDRSGGIYRFTYQGRENLPARNSFRIDHWGYYNAQNSNGLLPSYSAASYTGADRSVNETALLSGSLQKISYPTGGSTVFEMEAHKDGSGGILGGGLRVKSIANYNGSNALQEKKMYSYFSNFAAVSESGLVPRYLDEMQKRMPGGEGECYLNDQCDYWILSSTTVPVLGGYDFNTPVRYPKVEMKQVSGAEDLGKSVSYFGTLYYNTAIPTLMTDGTDQQVLLKEEHYKSTTSGYVKIKKKELTHVVNNDLTAGFTPTGNVPNYKQVLGFRIRYQLPEETESCGPNEIFHPATFSFSHYKYISVWDYNSTVVETSYEGTDSLKVYQEFRYDRPVHAQVTTAITVDSQGDTLKTITRYPQDYTNGGIASLGTAGQYMFRGLPIERYTLNGKDSLLSAQLNELSYTGYKLHFNKKHAANLNRPASLVTVYPDVNNQAVSTYFPSGHRYEQLYEITSYDAYNNPTEITAKGGVKQAMLWSGVDHRLMAVVDNAALVDIAYTDFDGTSHSGWTYTDTYDTSLKFSGTRSFSGSSVSRSGLTSGTTYKITVRANGAAPTISGQTATATTGELNGWNLYEWTVTGLTSVTITNGGKLDDLRIHPLGSTMSTFSHHPLLGVVKKTDANNVTQSYEYDAAGRLTAIKDQRGNIVQAFEYRYVNNGTGVY